jgi:hypothetical protein
MTPLATNETPWYETQEPDPAWIAVWRYAETSPVVRAFSSRQRVLYWLDSVEPHSCGLPDTTTALIKAREQAGNHRQTAYQSAFTSSRKHCHD